MLAVSHADAGNEPQKNREVIRTDVSSSPPIHLEPKHRQYRIVVCWGLASTVCLAITIWRNFATSALFHSRLSKIRLEQSYVLSNASVLLISGFMSELDEKLRRSLASKPSGINFASFIGLSRATGNMGVVRLLLSNWKFRDKKWC